MISLDYQKHHAARLLSKTVRNIHNSVDPNNPKSALSTCSGPRVGIHALGSPEKDSFGS